MRHFLQIMHSKYGLIIKRPVDRCKVIIEYYSNDSLHELNGIKNSCFISCSGIEHFLNIEYETYVFGNGDRPRTLYYNKNGKYIDLCNICEYNFYKLSDTKSFWSISVEKEGRRPNYEDSSGCREWYIKTKNFIQAFSCYEEYLMAKISL